MPSEDYGGLRRDTDPIRPLIAGIYGMNFGVMPELHWRYGYFVVLGEMTFLAGGLIWYFRWRRWPKG